MPSSPVPFCPVAGCAQRSRGPCAQHRAQRHARTDAQRGSRHARGYDARWVRFRAVFFQMLIARHLVPMCGARLSGLPSPQSHCAQQQRVMCDDLQLDHDPPLEAWERSHPERVCDPQRVQFLCAACHASKTREEMHRRQHRQGGESLCTNDHP
jgi:hypothetical protein